jgi:hypothetical protein
VPAAGEPPKLIDEFVGRASTGDTGMRSPSGWAEPGQRPEFDEFTVVLRGAVVVDFEDGAEYVSVCLPAFAPGTVHRDE